MPRKNESLCVGGFCMRPEMQNSNLGYLVVISVENINKCFWETCPINFCHRQNQRIRRDELQVISNNQFQTQIINYLNQSVKEKQTNKQKNTGDITCL